MKPIRVADIETPALLLDLDLLEKNILKMADFVRSRGIDLRPHYKTIKCPVIAHLQIKAGAKGICCAKLGEAETLVHAGIDDVLIANQVVDPAKVMRLAALARGRRLAVAVDHPDNVRDLSAAASVFGSTIHVLVEVDIGMGRCGVREAGEVIALARLIESAEGLVFSGIQAYEGHLMHDSREKKLEGVREASRVLEGIINELRREGMEVGSVSGGGTGTYDLKGNGTVWTELQAGSYALMDTTYRDLGIEFDTALSVLATVIHKRPGMAVTDAGMKACSVDMGQPRIKGHEALEVALHEEHGVVRDPHDRLERNMKVEYIPGHCCTTVNQNDRYHCIRNGVLEDIWPVTARGRTR